MTDQLNVLLQGNNFPRSSSAAPSDMFGGLAEESENNNLDVGLLADYSYLADDLLLDFDADPKEGNEISDLLGDMDKSLGPPQQVFQPQQGQQEVPVLQQPALQQQQRQQPQTQTQLQQPQQQMQQQQLAPQMMMMGQMQAEQQNQHEAVLDPLLGGPLSFQQEQQPQQQQLQQPQQQFQQMQTTQQPQVQQEPPQQQVQPMQATQQQQHRPQQQKLAPISPQMAAQLSNLAPIQQEVVAQLRKQQQQNPQQQQQQQQQFQPQQQQQQQFQPQQQQQSLASNSNNNNQVYMSGTVQTQINNKRQLAQGNPYVVVAGAETQQQQQQAAIAPTPIAVAPAPAVTSAATAPPPAAPTNCFTLPDGTLAMLTGNPTALAPRQQQQQQQQPQMLYQQQQLDNQNPTKKRRLDTGGMVPIMSLSGSSTPPPPTMVVQQQQQQQPQQLLPSIAQQNQQQQQQQLLPAMLGGAPTAQQQQQFLAAAAVATAAATQGTTTTQATAKGGGKTKKTKSQEQVERRRERNRLLARRTRERKKNLLNELQDEVLNLQRENIQLKKTVEHVFDDDEERKEVLEGCDAVEKLPEAVTEACGPLDEKKVVKEDFNLYQSIQQSQQAFVICDPNLPDMPIVFASEDFLKLTGYSRGEVLGRNCRFLQGVATSADKVNHIRKSLENDEDVSCTLVNYRSDGTPFWNKLFIAALRDDQNQVVTYMGVSVQVAGPEPGDPEHGKELPKVTPAVVSSSDDSAGAATN